MKKPSDHLFRLIKSLTKREKRAFRADTLHGKDAKKNMAIFDAMDAQEVYDEEGIKTKFRKEPWVGRFNAAKDYLYKSLIRSLTAYNQKTDPAYALDDQILDIKVLQDKGFYKRCGKLIQKAKLIAAELEEYVKILELLALEGRNHPGGINPTNAEQIQATQEEVLSKIRNEQAFDRKYKQSYAIISESGYQGFNKKARDEYDQLMLDPLLADFSKARTFNAQRQYINMHYFYALGKEDHDQTFAWILKAKEHFASRSILTRKQSVNYATTLLNLNTAYTRLGRYTEALTTIQELKERFDPTTLKQHERLSYIIDYAGLHHEVMTYRAMKKHDVASDLVKKLHEKFQFHEQEISEDVARRHYWLLGCVYFESENWKAANLAITVLIDELHSKTNTVLLLHSRILRLQIYYEQGKMELLEYALTATQRQFQKERKITPMEREIFRLFQYALDRFEKKAEARKALGKVRELMTEGRASKNYTFFTEWVTEILTD